MHSTTAFFLLVSVIAAVESRNEFCRLSRGERFFKSSGGYRKCGNDTCPMCPNDPLNCPSPPFHPKCYSCCYVAVSLERLQKMKKDKDEELAMKLHVKNEQFSKKEKLLLEKVLSKEKELMEYHTHQLRQWIIVSCAACLLLFGLVALAHHVFYVKKIEKRAIKNYKNQTQNERDFEKNLPDQLPTEKNLANELPNKTDCDVTFSNDLANVECFCSKDDGENVVLDRSDFEKTAVAVPLLNTTTIKQSNESINCVNCITLGHSKKETKV